LDASRQQVLDEGSQIVFDGINLDAFHHRDEGYDGVGGGPDIVDQQRFERVRLLLKHSGLVNGVHRPEPGNRWLDHAAS
jgi:hypothetical protein